MSGAAWFVNHPRPRRGTGRVGAPRSWGRLRIVSHEVERGSVGVLLDDATGTAAGVLVARADTAPLLDTAEAMRRADEFAALLVALARDARPVRRVSFVARRLPAEAGEHAAWFAQRRAAPLSATVVGTYADLVEQVRGDAVQHDLAVTLQISLRARRAELRALQRSGASREDAAARLVCEELRWLAAALEACGCRVAGALQPSLLCEALRSGVDPATPERMSRIRTAKTDDGMTSIAAGPGILEEGWSQLRSEAGWARTLWAASLPATAEAGFLAPLLAAAGGARSVALTLEPLAPRRATRLAQATVLDAEADAARREQRGTLDTALARRARQAARQSEAELAGGHALCRLVVYVTVHAASLEALDQATAQAEHDGARAGLELRVLAGEQARALSFTLPGLCGGLV